ncbi:hypothetical protein [Streptomyces griseomycini]|uniref:Lipoprotein n=1 Tax=Streptomyces griseomycini TaxID=66895 RepID=A0A7W7PPP1_9ACTN|nr:hypothetical protein [Streptomyces griseomycini]MBB4897737.1 hypothetical protein [Streptomyces griseomycini]GGQ20414.1 lipoprotein [Streptomyces griseomycini]GGR11727.1 lipoprotein [Streptomyces griseomycini]
MKRRSLPVAAAFAATAALLLTACGGEDGSSKANDEIAGADTGKTGKSPSPAAAATDSAQRPEVELPKDVTNTFDGWKTGDAAKDAVLADASRRIDALAYAITQGDPEEPVLGFYYKDDALLGAADWVQEFVKAKKSMTGETRYFKPNVNVYEKDKATLTYCSFEGEAFVKDRQTGKAEKTPVTDNSYLLYSTRLEKSDKGVWQTAVLNSERGNDSCTP